MERAHGFLFQTTGLPDWDVSLLADCFSPRTLEAVALNLMGFSHTELDAMKEELGAKRFALKRDILIRYRGLNPRSNVRKASNKHGWFSASVKQILGDYGLS